jgi:hypothetical protein
MVNFNGTELHKQQPYVPHHQHVPVSDDSSSLFFQHQNNGNHALLSQGTNQILFDSKVFSQMPSQYQNGGIHLVENTTLNNPFSME